MHIHRIFIQLFSSNLKEILSNKPKLIYNWVIMIDDINDWQYWKKNCIFFLDSGYCSLLLISWLQSLHLSFNKDKKNKIQFSLNTVFPIFQFCVLFYQHCCICCTFFFFILSWSLWTKFFWFPIMFTSIFYFQLWSKFLA